MSRTRTVAIVALGVLAAACTTTAKPPPIAWSGGDPHHLASDDAVCRDEAARLDVSQPSTYSDPRYGVTSAMADAVARDNPLADRGAIVREAAYEACMNDKGWRQPQ
jgi:hypothetical protein